MEYIFSKNQNTCFVLLRRCVTQKSRLRPRSKSGLSESHYLPSSQRQRVPLCSRIFTPRVSVLLNDHETKSPCTLGPNIWTFILKLFSTSSKFQARQVLITKHAQSPVRRWISAISLVPSSPCIWQNQQELMYAPTKWKRRSETWPDCRHALTPLPTVQH